MRIALFNPQGNFDNQDSYWTEHPDFGGQLVYVKELAKALDRLGHEAVIFTRLIKDPAWPEFSGELELLEGSGVIIVRIPFGGDHFLPKESLWPHIKEYTEGVALWYRERGILPDAVTAHYADGGVAAAMFEEFTGIPFTFTAHSLGAQKLDKLQRRTKNFEILDHSYHFSLRLAAERAAIGRALIRVVSTNQEMLEQYGHPLYADISNPITLQYAVIPPGVNQTVFYDNPVPSDRKTVLYLKSIVIRDIDHNRKLLPFAVASSRLDPKKNVVGLVNAFAQSTEWQEKGNLLLVVRGIDDPVKETGHLESEEKEQLEQILGVISKTNLRGKVAFANLRSQESLAAVYRELSQNGGVFCLASLYEGFGLATIEAMACGLPAVVTANGGGSEILQDGDTAYGILVDPENPESIAGGVLEILQKKDRWEHFRKLGLERIKSTYNWDKSAALYSSHIEKAIYDRRKNQQELPPIPDYFTDPNEKNHQALKKERMIRDYWVRINQTDL